MPRLTARPKVRDRLRPSTECHYEKERQQASDQRQRRFECLLPTNSYVDIAHFNASLLTGDELPDRRGPGAEVFQTNDNDLSARAESLTRTHLVMALRHLDRGIDFTRVTLARLIIDSCPSSSWPSSTAYTLT